MHGIAPLSAHVDIDVKILLVEPFLIDMSSVYDTVKLREIEISGLPAGRREEGVSLRARVLC